MKIQYRFDSNSEWRDYTEAATMYEAKQAAKKLKKHIGTCGKVRIVDIEK